MINIFVIDTTCSPTYLASLSQNLKYLLRLLKTNPYLGIQLVSRKMNDGISLSLSWYALPFKPSSEGLILESSLHLIKYVPTYLPTYLSVQLPNWAKIFLTSYLPMLLQDVFN